MLLNLSHACQFLFVSKRKTNNNWSLVIEKKSIIDLGYYVWSYLLLCVCFINSSESGNSVILN